VFQAALAHLESIIYDPFHPESEKQEQADEESKQEAKSEEAQVNGH